MYGYICEHCGAHLDPGEPCDCRKMKNDFVERCKELLETERDGQLSIRSELYDTRI